MPKEEAVACPKSHSRVVTLKNVKKGFIIPVTNLQPEFQEQGGEALVSFCHQRVSLTEL